MATRISNANIPLSAGNIGVDLTPGFQALERGLTRAQQERQAGADREAEAQRFEVEKGFKERQLGVSEGSLELERLKIDILKSEKVVQANIRNAAELGIRIGPDVDAGNLEAVKSTLVEQRSRFEASGNSGMLADIDEKLRFVQSGDVESLAREVRQSGDVGVALDEIERDNETKATTEFERLLGTGVEGGVISEKQRDDLIRSRLESAVAPKGQTININTASGFQGAFSEKFAEKLAVPEAERVDKRIALANEAIQQNIELNIAEELVLGGVQSGTGSETILKLKSLGKTLGVPGLDDANLGGQEILRQIQSKMALRARNPDSGLGLTGNTSNRDLEFLKAIAPGLANTAEGNLAIIEATRAKNRLVVALQQEQFDFMTLKGLENIKPGQIDAHLIEFANSFEVFTNEQREKFQELANISEEQGSEIPIEEMSIDSLRAIATSRSVK